MRLILLCIGVTVLCAFAGCGNQPPLEQPMAAKPVSEKAIETVTPQPAAVAESTIEDTAALEKTAPVVETSATTIAPTPASGNELVLFDFESPEELDHLAKEDDTMKWEQSYEFTKSGRSSLKVRFPVGSWPGIQILPTINNWSRYDRIYIDVYTSSPRNFNIRFDDSDSRHGESSTRDTVSGMAVAKGWTRLVVNFEDLKKVNLKKIKKFVPYIMGNKEPVDIYFDNIRLSKGEPQDTLLADFENEEERQALLQGDDLKETALSGEYVKKNKQALKINFPVGGYPGVALHLSGDQKDWSQFEAFKFDICGTGAARPLLIRIDDDNSKDYASRYNNDSSFLLKKGWSTVQLDLEAVAKKIDLKKVKMVLIFLAEVKEPTIGYLDNVRLGDKSIDPLDMPIRGEEGPRRDIVYSTEIVTPHVDWADNFITGTINGFFIPSIAQGRDLTELMQRMNLDVTAVSIDPNWDANCWGIGDYYVRGEQGDFRLVLKYVQKDILSDNNYNVMVIPGLNGWTNFSRKTRDKILQRVTNGAGLVLIHPFVGDETKDNLLWDLSPLVNVGNNTVGSSGYPRVNKEAVQWSDAIWKMEKEHFITSGLPLDAIPSKNLPIYKYEVGDGEVLISAGNYPLLGVKQYGKGRVVTLAYKESGFVPQEIDPNSTGVRHDYWEYYYSLMAKSILWAAGKESGVAVNNVSADDNAVTFALTQKQPSDLSYTCSLKDEWGEQYAMLEGTIAASDKNISIAVSGKLRPGLNLADIILFKGKQQVNWLSASHSVEKVNWISRVAPSAEDIEPNGSIDVVVGIKGVIPEGSTVSLAVIDNLGRITRHLTQPAEIETSLTVDFNGFAAQFATFEAKLQSSDGVTLSRSLSKPVYAIPVERNKKVYVAKIGWSGRWKRWQKAMIDKLILDQGTIQGNIGGASRLNNSTGAKGLGHHRNEKARYDKQKRNFFKTGDTKHLHREPCFEDPVWRDKLYKTVYDNVKKRAKFRLDDYFVADESSITSYRDSFDFCFSEHSLKAMRIWLKDKYETLEMLNTEWDTAFIAWDAVQPFTSVQAQEENNWISWCDHRLFMNYSYAGVYKLIKKAVNEADPEGLTALSGTQQPAPCNGSDWYQIDQSIDHIIAYGGGNQRELHRSFNPESVCGFWTGYGSAGPGVKHAIWQSCLHKLVNPNIFWGYSFLNPDYTYSKSAADMGQAFNAIRNSGIGRYILEADRHHDKVAIHFSYPSIIMTDIDKSGGDFQKSQDSFVFLVEDAGLQHNFVASQQIEAGGLKDYNVLVMPRSIALSDKEAAEIRTFVERGGILIADIMPGLYKENGRKRESTPFASFFASGKGVLLGKEALTYSGLRKKNEGETILAAMKKVLTDNDVSAEITVTPLHRSEVVSFSLPGSSNKIICILRENVGVKAVTGADGVTQYVGTAERTGQPVTVTFPAEAAVYDLTDRKALGTGTSFQTELFPGECRMLAVSNEPVAKALLTIPVQAERDVPQIYTYTLEGAQSGVNRIIRFNVIQPDGIISPIYSQDVMVNKGLASITLRFALNDPVGVWQVEAFDLDTGKTASKKINL